MAPWARKSWQPGETEELSDECGVRLHSEAQCRLDGVVRWAPTYVERCRQADRNKQAIEQLAQSFPTPQCLCIGKRTPLPQPWCCLLSEDRIRDPRRGTHALTRHNVRISTCCLGDKKEKEKLSDGALQRRSGLLGLAPAVHVRWGTAEKKWAAGLAPAMHVACTGGMSRPPRSFL